MIKEELIREWLTEEQVAEVLGIAVGTLRNKRYSGKPHPPFNRALKRYSREKLLRWIDENE